MAAPKKATTSAAASSSAASSSTSPSAQRTAQEIKTLLRQLRNSSRKRNGNGGGSGANAAIASSSAERDDAHRLESLRKIFARLAERGEFDPSCGGGGGGGGDDGASSSKKWKAWLAMQHSAFVAHLQEGVAIDGRTSALRTYCGVLASSPVASIGIGGGGGGGGGEKKEDDGSLPSSEDTTMTMVSERLLNGLLESAVKSRHIDFNYPEKEEEQNHMSLTTDEAVLSMLESEFVRPHRDVQYFVYKGLRQISLDVSARLHRMMIEAEKRRRRRANEEVEVAKAAAAEKRKEKKKKKNGDSDNKDKDGDEGEDCDAAAMAMVIARAEKDAGLVAENMCRLLMMMDYVPKDSSDLVEGEGMAGYLFPPPASSVDDDGDDDEDNGGDDYDDAKEEDSEAGDDDDSDASSDSSPEDETSTKGRKRSLASSSISKGRHSKNKRPKGEAGNGKGRGRRLVVAWQRPYKHRHAHQEAWLSVLRLPDLPARTQKLVLQHLSSYVLGACPSPLRFAEYFTRSFRGGTSTTAVVNGSGGGNSNSSNGGSSSSSLASILSLHGLFVLMLDHGLEYPKFYDSLYRLLRTPRVLYTKHRTRFLRLLSKSLLSNSMLPAYVVASFVKRLCGMALCAPPSGGLYALALAGNLLRKHPECACLIHRRGDEDEGGMMRDVFVEDADDLADTRALESSLWELAALERHYHPAVSTLAKSVGTEADDGTTPMHDLEDFLAHTYKSLFEQEKKRLGGGGGGGAGKQKRGGSRVSLTFAEPEGLFTKDDVFCGSFKCS